MPRDPIIEPTTLRSIHQGIARPSPQEPAREAARWAPPPGRWPAGLPAVPPDGSGAAGRATPAPAGRAATVFDLTGPEQLLLWSARRWRHGRFGWSQVEVEFRRAAGPRWADALIAWEQALDLLHRWPSALPDIRNGCDTALSGDERALLTAVAVVQAGPPLAPELLLARLARPCERGELRRLLEELAEALGALSLYDAAVRAVAGGAGPRPFTPAPITPPGHRTAG